MAGQRNKNAFKFLLILLILSQKHIFGVKKVVWDGLDVVWGGLEVVWGGLGCFGVVWGVSTDPFQLLYCLTNIHTCLQYKNNNQCDYMFKKALVLPYFFWSITIENSFKALLLHNTTRTKHKLSTNNGSNNKQVINNNRTTTLERTAAEVTRPNIKIPNAMWVKQCSTI